MQPRSADIGCAHAHLQRVERVHWANVRANAVQYTTTNIGPRQIQRQYLRIRFVYVQKMQQQPPYGRNNGGF
jgi:hypothetical protein